MELELLANACRDLIQKRNDFWLLAALTGYSYEEGQRNRGFAKRLASFEIAGASGTVCRWLEVGINGNLAEIVQASSSVSGRVARNPSRVPDIAFRSHTHNCLVEIKLIFDYTLAKYYPSVAEDGNKLRALAAPNHRLFQVVFFVQLPNHRFPEGSWFGCPESKPRAHWLVHSGIDAQFSTLRMFIQRRPDWPGEQPFKELLRIPGDSVDHSLLERWFSTAFHPSTPWKFDPKSQLKDAAVGVAIWEHH